MTTAFLDRKKTPLREELEALFEEGGGYLSPHALVSWAREHPDSVLHKRFQWDDRKAADAYRLDQARRIIQVHVEVAAETGHRTRAFVSLEENRLAGQGYKPIRDVLEDPLERKLFLAQARRELVRWREKYSTLEELEGVFNAIDQEGLERAG